MESKLDNSYEFNELINQTNNCELCSNHSKPVLSNNNGNLNSKIMFIGKNPGVGANRTRKPFYGDDSGNNFQEYLDESGIKRDEIFVTNSALCAFRENEKNKNNIEEERKNCLKFLEKQINLINPEVIVTLGGEAFISVNEIYEQNLKFNECVNKQIKINDIILFPIYHVLSQNISLKRFTKDEFIQKFKEIKELLK